MFAEIQMRLVSMRVPHTHIALTSIAAPCRRLRSQSRSRACGRSSSMLEPNRMLEDSPPILRFRADGEWYSVPLVLEPTARPPVYVHDDSSIELAGFRAPVRRTHGEREALHELLAQNGCVLPTEIPADGPGWQRHLNELLCQPRPARDIVEQWLLGGCGAESQAEDPVRIRKNNRPLLMIGGRATAKEEARLVCAVVLLRPWCQPAGATHVIWSSSDGWTYPAAANDASNIAEAARLCWRGREYNLRLARCYQEAWRKPKPPKRTASILQPGCVLLRNAFSAHEQQSLVDTCIRVGEHAKAGFFTPTYEANGAMGSHSMRLQMVCLGRHWDHCNGSYSPRRTNIDDEPVLPVPDELSAAAAKVARWASLAGDAPSAATGGRCAGTRAISEDEIVSIPSAVPSAVEEGGTQDAKSAAPSDADEGEWAEDDEEDELPTSRAPDTALGEHSHSEAYVPDTALGEPYVPDIVIINRYGRHGSLGLHQDKDESAASLAAGTPIVSISLGDSCVFVVGPPTAQVGGAPPPPSECQYVRLHSGDAIVFGGPSRLVWHGVKSVFSGSAPGFLRLPEKPCRLNLTMRRF